MRENDTETAVTKDDKRNSGSAIDRLVREKKENAYEKVPLSLKQMNVIVYVLWGLLALVVVLIILDACGVFKLFG